MVRLTPGRKSRKKQSQFQRLWARAEKLQTANRRFQDRLDEILQRMQSEILPLEQQIAQRQIPLLRRLLTLGQRKSLSKWQRKELDGWIQELLEPLTRANALDDELQDDVTRYNAFCLGIELDENASMPLLEQLEAQLKQEAAFSPQPGGGWSKIIDAEVEKILDDNLGPEPRKPNNSGKNGDDLFQEELNEELERRYDEYHKKRAAAREELLQEMMHGTEGFDEEDDSFDSDFNPFGSTDDTYEENDSKTPTISNAVFKRLFRSTASQLHPDRESDPDTRKEKHALMSRLLEARKKGDVMTIVEMYQRHVSDATTLSKADEKQLIETLKQQIEELEYEQEAYSFKSPAHRTAYELFYYPSRRKTNQAFKEFLQTLEKSSLEAESLAKEITSIKSLKPYLERRYDDRNFYDPFDALDEFFDIRR